MHWKKIERGRKYFYSFPPNFCTKRIPRNKETGHHYTNTGTGFNGNNDGVSMGDNKNLKQWIDIQLFCQKHPQPPNSYKHAFTPTLSPTQTYSSPSPTRPRPCPHKKTRERTRSSKAVSGSADPPGTRYRHLIPATRATNASTHKPRPQTHWRLTPLSY